MKNNLISLNDQASIRTQNSSKSQCSSKRLRESHNAPYSQEKSQINRKKIKSDSFFLNQSAANIKYKEFPTQRGNLNINDEKLQKEAYCVNNKKSFMEGQNSTLKDKYSYLIEENPVKHLTFQIKNIIYVQSKLDDHLYFMKNIRQKRFGQGFKEIKKNLSEGSHANLTLTIFKQIMFIAPHFYDVKIFKSDEDLPYLINIPAQTQSTKQRKIQFLRLIYKFINKQKAQIDGKNQKINQIQIPLFQFQSKKFGSETLIREVIQQKKKLFFAKQNVEIKALSILDKSCNFKQKLYKLIKQKQQRIKVQSRNVSKTQTKIDKQQIEVIITEIYRIYSSKKVHHLFYFSLIQNLLKKLKIFTNAQQIAHAIKIIEVSNGGFLKILEHTKGKIAVINKKKYQQTRKDLGLKVQLGLEKEEENNEKKLN